MVKLKELIRSVQDDLPITMRMERWMIENPSPTYSPEAVEHARAFFAHEVGGNRQRAHRFRSSGIGQCERKRLFGAMGMAQETDISSELANTFATGNFYHLKWQMSGLTEGWLKAAEVPVELTALHFGGTLDGVLFDDSGLEVKSINDRGFSQLITYGPKEPHIRQTHGYMYAGDIDTFSILYENKNNGAWREYRVHRDEKIIKEIDTELGQLNQMFEDKKLPKMLPNCETKEGTVYRQCPFKNQCPKVKKWPLLVKGKLVSDVAEGT